MAEFLPHRVDAAGRVRRARAVQLAALAGRSVERSEGEDGTPRGVVHAPTDIGGVALVPVVARLGQDHLHFGIDQMLPGRGDVILGPNDAVSVAGVGQVDQLDVGVISQRLLGRGHPRHRIGNLEHIAQGGQMPNLDLARPQAVGGRGIVQQRQQRIVGHGLSSGTAEWFAVLQHNEQQTILPPVISGKAG